MRALLLARKSNKVRPYWAELEAWVVEHGKTLVVVERGGDQLPPQGGGAGGSVGVDGGHFPVRSGLDRRADRSLEAGGAAPRAARCPSGSQRRPRAASAVVPLWWSGCGVAAGPRCRKYRRFYDSAGMTLRRLATLKGTVGAWPLFRPGFRAQRWRLAAVPARFRAQRWRSAVVLMGALALGCC
jgi:hypothetical protein